jgi:hypothetical protein
MKALVEVQSSTYNATALCSFKQSSHPTYTTTQTTNWSPKSTSHQTLSTRGSRCRSTFLRQTNSLHKQQLGPPTSNDKTTQWTPYENSALTSCSGRGLHCMSWAICASSCPCTFDDTGGILMSPLCVSPRFRCLSVARTFPAFSDASLLSCSPSTVNGLETNGEHGKRAARAQERASEGVRERENPREQRCNPRTDTAQSEGEPDGDRLSARPDSRVGCAG